MAIDADSEVARRMPAIIAAIVAVTGMATLWMLNGSAGDTPANGGGMITAAVVYRAGAVVVPSAPISGHAP